MAQKAYVRANRKSRSRSDLITFLVALAAGALVSGLSASQQEGLAALVRGSALLPFIELHRFSAERSSLRVRAERLQGERDSLFAELIRIRAIAERASPIRDLLGFSAPVLGTMVPAELAPGQSRVGEGHGFVARSRDLGQVTVPAGVMTGQGMVGVLRAVYGETGRGDFWTHPDFRASVETEDGAISGIVRPVRMDSEQVVMLLEGAPFQREIAPGTRLVTTGLAGVFPPGILVGTVREQAEEESGWMKRYVLEPAVRPEAADVVLVWRSPADA